MVVVDHLVRKYDEILCPVNHGDYINFDLENKG